jgi:hypothetical protein
MPTRFGTIDDYLGDLDAEIEERGLKSANIEDIAPICITLWADLNWAKEAEAAVKRLAKQNHPILRIGPAGGIPSRVSFRDLQDQSDQAGLMLLYKRALLGEISKHLDGASWNVRADQYGALEIERSGETVFSGDAWGEFGWYATADQVRERCADVENAEAPGGP